MTCRATSERGNMADHSNRHSCSSKDLWSDSSYLVIKIPDTTQSYQLISRHLPPSGYLDNWLTLYHMPTPLRSLRQLSDSERVQTLKHQNIWGYNPLLRVTKQTERGSGDVWCQKARGNNTVQHRATREQPQTHSQMLCSHHTNTHSHSSVHSHDILTYHCMTLKS